MHKRGLSFAALSFCIFILFSCASTPKASDEESSVVVPAPQKSSYTYFSSLPSRIMESAENASPEDLRQTASRLHKSVAEDYTESEKILLNICSEVMAIVWPSESFTWEVPEISFSSNPYTGAIDSARRGIYDVSTGNTDFFTVLLPSLVLVTSPNRKDLYDLCEKSLLNALNLKSSSVLANYLMGLLCLYENRNKEAISFFTRSLGFAPSVYELNYAIAKAYMQDRQYEKALEISKGLLDKAPQNVSVLELCAESSYALEDLDAAESYIVRVLLLEPENLRYVLFRAGILITKGDYIRASSLLDMYAKTDTSSKEYLLLRARMQRDWNKNNAASGETIGMALTLYPDDKEILLFAAEVSSSANILVGGYSALEIAEKILSIDSSNVSAMKISVSEYKKKEEWQTAYDINSKLIELSPNDKENLYSQVDICLALSKNEEAMRTSLQLYTSFPDDENAQSSYIKVLVSTNQKNSALQLITKLLSSASQKMKSFLYYERSFLSGTEDAVLSDLRSSLTANPRNKDALYRLYEIYYQKKDWRRAQYYLKQVVALDPSNSVLLKKNSELDSLLGK